MIGVERPRVVQVSVREAHNPNADQLRHSQFVLRQDTREIYSVDRYVWPVCPKSTLGWRLDSLATSPLVQVYACTERSEYGLSAYLSDLGVLPEDSRMTFLGFDVADDSLISGLLNCEYGEDELAHLRQRWVTSLNDYHLFSSRDDAATFRALSNERVPEHAPFLIYQLWSKPTDEA